MSTHLYDLAEGPSDLRRRAGRFYAPETPNAADAADARSLVRHLQAQRADDARTATREAYESLPIRGLTFSGRTYGAIVASHHDGSGRIK